MLSARAHLPDAAPGPLDSFPQRTAATGPGLFSAATTIDFNSRLSALAACVIGPQG